LTPPLHPPRRPLCCRHPSPPARARPEGDGWDGIAGAADRQAINLFFFFHSVDDSRAPRGAENGEILGKKNLPLISQRGGV